MTLTEWAENEIKLACEREKRNCKESTEWDYGCACYESALKAYQSLMEDGHSGISFNITKNILIHLMNELPLTPIEDTDDVWSDIADTSGLKGEKVNYQCKRRLSLFKYIYDDGTIIYRDHRRITAVDINNQNVTYSSGLSNKIYDEMFPITMPYMPELPAKMLREDFLYDSNNGDFDTIGLFKIIKPNGETIDVNRFFKETNREWVEINETEYYERKQHVIRKENNNVEE